MNFKDNIKDILKHECFQTLSNNDFDNIAKNSTILHFKKGEYIIKQGSFITHICYLLDGLAKVNINQNNKTNTLRIIPNDRFIGIQYTFADNINNFSSLAIKDSEVLLIDINAFKQLMTTNGFFALEIAKTISLICHKTTSRIITYREKNIHGSLATFIIHYSRIYDSMSFTLPYTRVEISEMIGYSRESVIHTFTKFNKDGLINIKDRNIEILNYDLLKSIAING